MHMNVAQLRALDLNLLLILHVLLSERSVTRAAAKLSITQSAVSHALAKLRDRLDDPLFIRTAAGLVPTVRAEQLAPQLEESLAGIERALRFEAGFDPRTAARTFTLAAADFAELVLLPPLLHRLGTIAPQLDLRVRPPNDALEGLESGAVDLLIGLSGPAASGLKRQKLFEDRFVSILRQGHPEAGAKLTLDQFCQLPHALIAPRGQSRGIVDDELARIGRSRRIGLIVPHFLIAPLMIAESELILTLPERVATRFAELLPLQIFPPPLELPPITISQAWHERSQHDPAHVWLRQQIVEVAAAGEKNVSRRGRAAKR